MLVLMFSFIVFALLFTKLNNIDVSLHHFGFCFLSYRKWMTFEMFLFRFSFLDWSFELIIVARKELLGDETENTNK